MPVRVKELRRACLEGPRRPGDDPTRRPAKLRRDLNDLFVVIQLFSYPGDYVRECPTVERLAETLTKFEQDVARASNGPAPRAPAGPSSGWASRSTSAGSLAAGGRSRNLSAALTAELESRIQGLLDAIGPGRPLPAAMIGGLATAAPVS